MKRRIAAVVILLAWAAALGALVRREFATPTTAQLEAGPILVSPWALSYAVEQNGRQVGLASVSTDTSAAGVELVERYDITLPDSTVLTSWQETSLSRALSLKGLHGGRTSKAGGRRLLARAGADSMLHVVATRGRRGADSLTVPFTRDLTVSGAIALRLVAAAGDLKVGQRDSFTVIRPWDAQAHRIDVRVTAESVFVLSDSAVFDSASNDWQPAQADSVRAWQLLMPNGERADTSWIDAQGRLIAATTPEGYRVIRAPFEIVHANYRRLKPRPQAPMPGKAP